MSDTIIFPSIYPIACHTDNIGPNSTFVAIKGIQEDGIKYIAKAIEKGATKIVCEQGTILPEAIQNLILKNNITIEHIANSRRALAQLSAQAANYPAEKLKIIGVTGTKGKSTTSYMLEHLLKTAGYKTAIISTVKNKINNTEFPAPLTTPQPDYIHQFLDLCVQNQVEYVVMEVAAQALSLHRVYTIQFDAAIFTNFSLEHSEFYENIDLYFAAKARLFEQLKAGGIAIINSDDAKVAQLAETIQNKICFGTNKSDVSAQIIENNLESGLKILVNGCESNSPSQVIHTPQIFGQFNVYNILAACALAQKLKIEQNIIQQAFATFPGIPGRLQSFRLDNGSIAFIDYAHNPSSFEAVLSTLKELTEDLIVVFGAGGDRDPIKRPIMGDIATQIADRVIITSDNPRSEEPKEIAKQIIAGVKYSNSHKFILALDREEAIKKAIAIAKNRSIIALLGKGPDEYQIIKGEKIYFSEATILRSFQKNEIIR